MDREIPWVAEGLITGFIGYLTVILLFGVLNLVSGEGFFHTPAALGSALFFRSGDAGGMTMGPAPIVAYNGVHILASLLIGVGAAWLVFQTERNRPLWYIVFFVFLAGFIYSLVVMGIFASEMAGILSWPAILMANLLAGVTAGGYLWWRHGRLVGLLGEDSRGG